MTSQSPRSYPNSLLVLHSKIFQELAAFHIPFILESCLHGFLTHQTPKSPKVSTLASQRSILLSSSNWASWQLWSNHHRPHLDPLMIQTGGSFSDVPPPLLTTPQAPHPNPYVSAYQSLVSNPLFLLLHSSQPPQMSSLRAMALDAHLHDDDSTVFTPAETFLRPPFTYLLPPFVFLTSVAKTKLVTPHSNPLVFQLLHFGKCHFPRVCSWLHALLSLSLYAVSQSPPQPPPQARRLSHFHV